MSLSCRFTVSREEVETKLKKTMTEYLYKSVNNDSSKVKYRVLNVIFFEEKTLYRCEFDVKLSRPNGWDTTGKMTADIRKDFKKVVRKS